MMAVFNLLSKKRGETGSGSWRRYQEVESSFPHHTTDTLVGSFDSMSLSGASFM